MLTFLYILPGAFAGFFTSVVSFSGKYSFPCHNHSRQPFAGRHRVCRQIPEIPDSVVLRAAPPVFFVFPEGGI
ncbi:hypothetical protein, partial [Enterobacter roggenkampii]|uniref:hypothetical protein n=1 Tax=Enterobacter roggenkampii TaxID=1812935 RepID=UPI002FCFE909